jgi:hypothetical protein
MLVVHASTLNKTYLYLFIKYFNYFEKLVVPNLWPSVMLRSFEGVM